MPRRSMFPLIISKSLRNRWGRVWVAVLAVAVGATLATSLLTLSMGVEGMVGRELRGYGANILVTPRAEIFQVGSGELGFGSIAEGNLLREASLEEIRSAVPEGELVGYTPYLYVPVDVGSGSVVFAGTWPDEVREVSPWWKVEGGWVENRESLDEVMVGKTLAVRLGVHAGEGLTISHRGHVEEVRIVGLVETGGPEEDQIVGTLRLAQNLTGEVGGVQMVWVSVQAQGSKLESVAEKIEERVAGSEAKILSQIVLGEELFLSKMGFVMAMVTSLILVASGLSVMSTMTTSVMERRGEIGLLKALGVEDRRISLLHFTEASLIGFAGGIAGYLVGTVSAILIGLDVYGQALPLQPIMLPLTILVSVGVSVLSSIIPVRNALRMEAAVVLSGG